MTSFYREYKSSRDAAVSLQKAMKTVQTKENTRSPQHWAAFSIVGVPAVKWLFSNELNTLFSWKFQIRANFKLASIVIQDTSFSKFFYSLLAQGVLMSLRFIIKSFGNSYER